MSATSNFWSTFILMCIWIPLLVLWIFTLIDLFKRYDLNAWYIPLWLLFIIFVPLLGVITCCATKPPGKRRSVVDEAYRRSEERGKGAAAKG